MRPLYNILLVSSGKILSLLSLFVVGVVVARTTGPSAYGYYNSALALLLIFDAILGQPLDSAMIQFNSLHNSDEPRLNRAQGLILRTKLRIGGFVATILILGSPWLSPRMFGVDGSPWLLIIVALGAFVLLMLRSTSSYLQIHARFREYAVLDGMLGALRLVAVLVFATIGLRQPEPYLAAYGMCALVTLVIFRIYVPQPYFGAPRPDEPDRKRLRSYMGVTSGIIILGTITGRADVPILMALKDAEQAGHYSAAAQLAFLGALLAGYMAIVLHPKVVELSRQKKLAKLIRLNVFIASLVAVACVPVAFWILPSFIPMLFGQEYAPSVPILQIMLIGTCADLVIMPVLLPFAIQMMALRAFYTEIIIAAVFFAIIAWIGFDMDGLKMAWLVSGTRCVKLIAYFTMVGSHLRTRR